MPPEDYTDVTEAIDTDAAPHESKTPTVKRIEIHYQTNAGMQEDVYYAAECGYNADRAELELHHPAWPRRGYSWTINLPGVVEMFVEEVPLTSVPEVADDEPMGA